MSFYRRIAKAEFPMIESSTFNCPTISYRPIQPSDLDVLEQIHIALFPIRYEKEFFVNVINGNGIVSWAAVDSKSDIVIGFVTARIILANESEIGDLLRYDSTKESLTLVYILTLGVIEAYRNLGIATSLTQKVIKYASSIPTCRAVYLHVISYNDPAICFYRRMLFKCIRRLPKFYYIRGKHYDSYLFVYFVNGGGRSRCSPIEFMAAIGTYIRDLFTSLASKLWKNEKKASRWFKNRESDFFLSRNRKGAVSDNNESQCV